MEKNVMRIVKKGSRRVIDGSEIELTTDGLYDENQVRVILADIALGAGISNYKLQISDPDAMEALERISDDVKVTNLHQMQRMLLNAKWTVIRKGTLLPMAGQLIKLDIDEEYYQSDARYMFADMCLGGPVAFYRESLRLSRDPNIKAALEMLDDSVKIQNLWQFERKTYPDNKCNIVFKGTDKRIDGSDVQLSTDLIGDAEVRYKMVDIGLGAPLSFYQADAKNATNIIMFDHFENDVRVMNLCDFERNRFSDLGMLDVFKGTKTQITGEEVVLSSDLTYSEAPIRKMMAQISLGGGENSTYPSSLYTAIAKTRLANGDKVLKIDNYDLTSSVVNQRGLVYAGTEKEVNGADIVLNTDIVYNEIKVRELMALKLLQDQFAFDAGNPDHREANQRLSKGITVDDITKYQAVNGSLFYRNSGFEVNPENILLSSDSVDAVFKVKELMLKVKLGLLKLADLEKDESNSLAQQAFINFKNGIKIVNMKSFEAKNLKGLGKVIVYSGTEKPIKAYDIRLETDHEWSEGQARFIMADMAAGGPVEFYEACTKHNDPIAIEPYNRWMKGVRVTNADRFERKFLPRIGWKIVYKGTTTIINPMDVKLTTDNQ
jgi:hypothetical protein